MLNCQRVILLILPTQTPCCPDTNIEDVVLSNMIGEIAESTAYTQMFSGLGFNFFRVLVLGFRVLGFAVLGFRVRHLGISRH